MDWTPILAYLQGVAPWATNALMILGTLVLIGTVVDAMVDDEKDKGFMKKALALPLVGSLLNHLKKFSPFNVKDKSE
ncbi:hypothetical protein N9948_00475 [bacterium]|nr:hypothetical protein [bacterium]